MNSLHEKRRVLKQRLYIVIVCIVLFVVLWGLFGCSSPFPDTGNRANHTSVHTEQPVYAPITPFRIVQVCFDTKPLVPDSLFHQATALVAGMLDYVTVNENGSLVYISYITSHSYHNDAFSFAVPALAADPQQPTLQPRPTPGDDPYKNSDQLNKVKIANAQILANWQAQLKSNHEKLAAVRAQVKQYANRLRSLPNVDDATGEDVAGCLQTASERFSGVGITARKTLIIASPLLNMVNAESTTNLWGASVLVVMKTCALASAEACIATTAAWKERLLSFGASHVTILDPQQSQVEKLTI